jgi:predicted ATPase
MISEWRLENFKSAAEKKILPLRPITIFAGPNSSGKSSILQSMLLIAQTLASKVGRRHLVLNGEAVKLGTFDDVLAEHRKSDCINIGFSFSVDRDFTAHPNAVLSRHYYSSGVPVSAQILATKFSSDLSFGPSNQDEREESGKPRQLQAKLISAVFAITGPGRDRDVAGEGAKTTTSQIEISTRPAKDLEAFAPLIESTGKLAGRTVGLNDLRYQVALNPANAVAVRNFRKRFLEGGAGLEIVATGLEHFLPSSLINKFELVPRIIGSVLEELADIPSANVESTLQQWENGTEGIVAAIARSLRTQSLSLGITPPELVKMLRSFFYAPEDKRSYDKISSVMKAAREAVASVQPPTVALEYVPPPEFVAFLNSAINYLFLNIRYLGPLRDEPKPVYSIANSADPADVGTKGQYTVAVLDLYETREVDFIPPDSLDAPATRIYLRDAVQAWMRHFGLADSFRTTEEGKLGHRLLIRPTGLNRDVDPTNVGVGVTQLLPIIVMALISPRGSTLLFEQPEFHVHPKVQSLLADFFLSVSRTGRQCIIETHSEYLINRLRLRVAKSPLEKPLHDQIMFYFVERPRHESIFRKVEMNEYGAIPDWPEGFFDQGPNESELILRAARLKHRNRQPGMTPE